MATVSANSSGIKMNEGDWICADPTCGNINFSRRSSCNRCKKDREKVEEKSSSSKKKLGTEIGKSAADKSRGLFSADDWQCSKCPNVNWARRQTCNVCNAPKFGEVEARTGYGGGYNERGVVEYRRREHSSDDEYDEFGRKKRKKKHSDHSSSDKVGSQDARQSKTAIPTKGSKENWKMAAPVEKPPKSGTNMRNNATQKAAMGSLSDGSACDFPPLTKSNLQAFKRSLNNSDEEQNEKFKWKQFKMYDNANAARNKKRRMDSLGDRDAFWDQAASSGYETGNKRIKRIMLDDKTRIKNICNAGVIMENKISSSNDVTYRFKGLTSAEDFEVTYTLEERVKAAAFAIVYNNCKISTDKFQTLYDKPAPDFKTIFAWRQRLLTTGCLVDNHLELNAREKIESTFCKPERVIGVSDEIKTGVTSRKKRYFEKQQQRIEFPNEENNIVLNTDSEDEPRNSVHSAPKVREGTVRHSSSSREAAETVIIGDDNNVVATAARSLTSVGDDRVSATLSRPVSSSRRPRSRSLDSGESNYPESDTDPDKIDCPKSRSESRKSASLCTSRNNIVDAVSESEEDHNSDGTEFFAKVYGENIKDRQRNRLLMKSAVAQRTPKFTNDENAQSFCSNDLTKSKSQRSLYTYNLNMEAISKTPIDVQAQIYAENEVCSNEYVPTIMGSSTKRNYQEFKDNIKKNVLSDGYWAKGNGTAFKSSSDVRVRSLSETNVEQYPRDNEMPTAIIEKEGVVEFIVAPVLSERRSNSGMPKSVEKVDNTFQKTVKENIKLSSKSQDFTEDDFDSCFVGQDQYTSFDKSLNKSADFQFLDRIASNDSAFLTAGDLSGHSKRNIMDIFGTSGSTEDPKNQAPAKPAFSHHAYETQWDEDDEALYNDVVDNSKGPISATVRTPSPPNIGSICAELVHVQEVQNVQTCAENESIEIIEKELCQQRVEKDSESPIKKKPVIEVVSQSVPKDVPSKANVQSAANEINETENLNAPPSSTNSQIQLGQLTSLFGINFAGVNASALALALQNIQDLTQKKCNESRLAPSSVPQENTITKPVDDDIEKNVEIFDEIRSGNDKDKPDEAEIGDIPFLSDIFDPNPVVPSNLTNKTSPLKTSQDSITNAAKNKNALTIGTIGSFKSFALPKPIMLNRLKSLTQQKAEPESETAEKVSKKKRKKRTVKGSSHARSSPESGGGGPTTAAAGPGSEEDEESGDEADLAKYDLCGSDGEPTANDHSKDDAENECEASPAKSSSSQSKERNGGSPADKQTSGRSRSSSSSSSSTSSSSSSRGSSKAPPRNKYDDFNLNSERSSRESSPARRAGAAVAGARPLHSGVKERRPAAAVDAPAGRRRERDTKSGGGDSRSHDRRPSAEHRHRSRDSPYRERRREERPPRGGRYSSHAPHHYSRARPR